MKFHQHVNNDKPHHVSPFFIVTCLKTSVSFYVDKLGFEIRFIGPDDDDGLRGFEVTDADGYVLFFGRPKV
jgi:catechol 2,3-dioxygenase-like lactoylglutathione lyase family enzyme